MRTLKIFIAGVIVGILCAPDSGAETRKKLVDAFSSYKDDAKDYVKDVADRVEDKIDAAKKAVNKM